MAGAGETHSEFSGRAEHAVQARDVSGGVHFHGAHLVRPVPRELPGPQQEFVDHIDQVDRLSEIADTLAEVDHSLTAVLSGTAGVGKTSLALFWAYRERGRFPDGQLYINLRGYDPGMPVSAAAALDRFLRALGVAAGEIPLDLEARAAAFRSAVAGRRMLLLLDNAVDAAQIRNLLPGEPGCLVLVTSRSDLPGLGTRAGVHRMPVDVLSDRDAAELFASVTNGHRDLGDQASRTEIVRLCARLPLALRIAAERAVSFPDVPYTDIVAQLRDESRLWEALSVEDAGEAADVRAVFAWSYRALSAPAARLFRLLGTGLGPDFSTGSAAALAGLSVSEARTRLSELAKIHLVERRGPDRYEIHDLLRAFAADQAHREDEPAELQRASGRMLAWYLLAAKELSRATGNDSLGLPAGETPGGLEVPCFPDAAAARTWFRAERANLEAAVARAAASGLDELVWRLPGVLLGVYAKDSMIDDWVGTAGLGLAAARRLGDRAGQAVILESLGKAYAQSDRFAQAMEYQRASLSLRTELGDIRGQARSLNALGLALWRAGEFAAAEAHYADAYTLAESVGDKTTCSFVLANLGELDVDASRPEAAVQRLDAALALHRELGHELYVADALAPLSRALLALGRIEQASAAARESLEIGERLESDVAIARALVELGRALRVAGDLDAALDAFHRALTHQARLGSERRMAAILLETAQTFSDAVRTDQAAVCRREAERLLASVGDIDSAMVTEE